MGVGVGSATQKWVYPKWPQETCPSVNFSVSHSKTFGQGRGQGVGGWGGGGWGEDTGCVGHLVEPLLRGNGGGL